MWLRTWLITVFIFAAEVERSSAADLSAAFTSDGLTLNSVGVGNVVNDRAELSVPAFMQTLGPPARTLVDGRTQRLTWDAEGIQLETMAPESIPFAVLFQFGNADSTNQGIIPSQPYRGTFDCLGISLSAGQQIDGQAASLSASGFVRESRSASGETWSRRLEHWVMFIHFSGSGAIDSAVIRILPDIY